MNEKILCKSHKSSHNITIVLFGIVFMLFLLFLINHNEPNPVGRELYLKQICITLFVSFILYCVFYLSNLKQIKIYKNYLEIDNLLKKRRIYFVEITKLEKQFIKAKYNSWTNHYLILKSGKKIKLIEEEYSNFDEFYSLIKKSVPK